MLQRVDGNFPKTSCQINERLGQNSPSLLSSSPPSTANSISKSMFGKFNSPILFPDVDDEEVTLDEYFHRQCSKHMTYKPVMGYKIYLPILQRNKLPILNQDAEEPSDDNPSPTTDDNKKISTDQKSLKLYSGHQCHRSHSGLFLGIMLLIASSVCMVLFMVHGSKGSIEFASFIYQQSKIALSFTSLLACIMAILQTNKLKFRRLGHGESFEYNLLTIGLIGCITYHIFLFIPAFETVLHILLFKSIDLEDHVDIEKVHDKTIDQNLNATNNQTRIVQITPSDIYYIALLYTAKCTLEIFQALLQFFFIVESSRRKVCCLNQALIKPGRSVIVFLLICNLALWLVNTFEVRRAETQLSLYIKYFGVRTWSVITYCFIPLIIFFRFHSTVCLAELWTKLYKLT
ncbi:unnamed protein product [Trichobilharzia szidati]|nr:unnamed protein product [Trichobilharzia szidati]